MINHHKPLTIEIQCCSQTFHPTAVMAQQTLINELIYIYMYIHTYNSYKLRFSTIFSPFRAVKGHHLTRKKSAAPGNLLQLHTATVASAQLVAPADHRAVPS
jgi:hypothetical protein